MAFIPAPEDTMRVTFIGSLRGQEVVNVMHGHQDVGGGVVITASLANDFFNAYKAAFVDNPNASRLELSSQYLLSQCVVTDVTVDGGATATSTLAPVAGVTSGASLPNEVALVVSLRTGLAGRSNRGRFYLGGISVGATDSSDYNRLTTLYTGYANSSAGDFLTAFNATGIDLVVASYYSGVDANGHPIPRAEAVVNPVTSLFVNQRFDSQRRRMPRT
jgi:hypothetical protein